MEARRSLPRLPSAQSVRLGIPWIMTPNVAFLMTQPGVGRALTPIVRAAEPGMVSSLMAGNHKARAEELFVRPKASMNGGSSATSEEATDQKSPFLLQVSRLLEGQIT